MNINYTYDYELEDNNNIPITTGRFTNALQSIDYNIGESSNTRLLRPYYEYNVEYFKDDVSIEDITFSISGGTFRRNANKFYFTADNNYINNGTLILRSIVVPTGWYGEFNVANNSGGDGYIYAYIYLRTYESPTNNLLNGFPITSGENVTSNLFFNERLQDINSELFLQITFDNPEPGYYLNITNYNLMFATANIALYNVNGAGLRITPNTPFTNISFAFLVNQVYGS
jgi:hypothetical protein